MRALIHASKFDQETMVASLLTTQFVLPGPQHEVQNVFLPVPAQGATKTHVTRVSDMGKDLVLASGGA